MTFTTIVVAAGVIVELAVLVRVMLRPHREPASRIAWVAVILALPLIGVIAYILFGEVNIGRGRAAQLTEPFLKHQNLWRLKLRKLKSHAHPFCGVGDAGLRYKGFLILHDAQFHLGAQRKRTHHFDVTTHAA